MEPRRDAKVCADKHRSVLWLCNRKIVTGEKAVCSAVLVRTIKVILSTGVLVDVAISKQYRILT